MAGLGVFTVKVSEVVFPVPPLVDETVTLMLSKSPVTPNGVVTFTVTVQVLPPATVPPVKRIPVSPAARTPPPSSSNVPPQVLVVVSGAATVMAPGATGKVSVNARPVRASFWLGLVIERVNVVVLFGRIGFGANNFPILGGPITVREAEALPVAPVFVPPFDEVINPLTF